MKYSCEGCKYAPYKRDYPCTTCGKYVLAEDGEGTVLIHANWRPKEIKINGYYRGQEGALKFIVDIANDYDGAKTVESLKQLIDEIRKEALQALKLKESYSK